MAKVLAKARRSPVAASYKPDDLDYAKFENINLVKKRAIVRPSSEARVSSRSESHAHRLVKTPTLRHRETERTRPPVIGADNLVLVKRPGSSSSSKYEESSKKLVQFRKCKTDIKILPDRQRPQTVQGLSGKSHTTEKTKHVSNGIDDLLRIRNDKTNGTSNNNHPLKEVRRKLQFENVDHLDDINDKETGQLDFTDKLAAIKSMINRSRDTRDISDRRAYYDEYKSSQKRVLVSRSDSLKENGIGDEKTDIVSERKDKTRRDRSQERSGKERLQERNNDKLKENRTRDVKSADIFKPKHVDGRLSVDLNKLKSSLEDRRQKVRDSDNDFTDQRHRNQQNGVHVEGNMWPSPVDDLIHAKSDRNILKSSVKSGQKFKPSEKIKTLIDTDEDMTNIRPSSRQQSRPNSRPNSRSGSRSRLESREMQTNLNQSVHSVQSNVPFYLTGEPLIDDTHRNSTKKIHRKTPSKLRDNVIGDFDSGNNLGTSSPGRKNHQDDKQTNVADFLGTSVTPEKEKLKYSHRQVDNDLEHLRSKLSWLMDRDGNEDGKLPNSKILSSKDVFKSANSNTTLDGHKRKSDMDDILKIGSGKSSGSEQKVKDWIQTQQVLSGDDKSKRKRNIQTVFVEELSVSVSIKSGFDHDSVKKSCLEKDVADELENSSNDTCDKYPVKLEKVHDVDTGRSRHKVIHSGSRGQGHFYKSHDHIHGYINEVPVRDLPTRHLVPDSDSTDTESSIVSLPFSVRSGESVSSTIQAVKLLRRLYHVEPDTRQNLVLMARCFRRWLNNVLHAKARNIQITEAAHRVSPVTYGVMIRKGEICYRTALLGQYFTTWRNQLQEAQLKKAIGRLQRKHLLRKGLNAFKWAINRSNLRQGILQDRISEILIAASFKKWKFRTSENRRLRTQQAFLRWRQFTKEAQKIRTLRSQTNKNLKLKLFKEWCERYATRVKQHKADAYCRSVLMSHNWLSWKWFTVVTKEKKERQTLAIQLYESTLQNKMFVQMKIEFTKYKKAKDKHRISQLKVAIQAWRLGSQLSTVERETNSRVAEVCWIRTTVRNSFTTWRDALLTRRAVRMSDANIIKKAFLLWSDRYKHLIQRRADVDQYVRTKFLSKTFTQWFMFVKVMRQRRAAAIECIHAVLQRRALQTWNWYTHYQRDLRRRLQLYIRKREMESQRKHLDLWRLTFKVKCDEQRAQQFWSNTCAKKASDHWRMVCHRRKLIRLLHESEPQRQLTVQRVFFMKWLARLQQIEAEKQEAGDVRLVLNGSLLRTCFDKWHTASLKLVLIKPMVLRYRHTLVTQCFQNWRYYVKHKAHCLQSSNEVIKLRLKHKFSAWRRQYAVHQIEKEYNKKLITRQAGRCLHAWQTVIKRKHSAKHFYEQNLLKSSFYYWNMLAVQQLRQKKLQHMEQESTMSALREYFDRWRARMHDQQTSSETGMVYIQQVQDGNRLRAMFTFWRRHFRATLIARENEKIRTRKLAKQALKEWHQFTQSSLQEAVQRFAAAIGLDNGGAGDNLVNHLDENETCAGAENEWLLDGHFEPLNFEQDLTGDSGQSPRTPKTPRTPQTPRTPRHGSSYGTPLKRLFSPSQSRQSLAQSQDFDGPLLSSSFLDARFEMEQAVKTESRREIVVTAVTRLRHWPLSNIFDQWKDYTARQLEFKQLTAQMKSVQEKLELSVFFRGWITQYRNTQLAKQHYEQVIQHKGLLSLILYRNSRKHKTHLKTVANQQYARTVFTTLFPVWLRKTQEKQHTENILHLWTNITAEEQQLIPRERSFKYKQNRKLLLTCFTTWQTEFRKIDKLKTVYHKILLERYFSAWSKWAIQRHRERINLQEFRNKRIKTLVFKQWCLRHKQKTEVARRYEDTWHNYQCRIFKTWLQWAQDQRKHKLLACQVIQTRNKNLVTRMFTLWKESTEKQIEMQRWFDVRLSKRTLQAWHEVTVWQKDLRNRMLQCRLMSYKILARQAFQHWHASYCRRLDNRRLHDQIVEKRILRIAKKWRRKAQKTRGEWLKQNLEQRLMQRHVEKWKLAFSRNQDRLVVLDEFVSNKNSVILSQCLITWRTELMALQAGRVFNIKLMVTFVENWKLTAQACKQRRKALLSYQSKKQIHTQKGYFLYWFNVAMARKSIRGHANLKMQLSVFKAWLLFTRKEINLRRLETTFTRKKNQKTLQKYWYMMKTRFQYCAELTEISNGVIQEKNNRLMKMALSHWDFRLKIVIADEFYEHLLAKRAAKQWCRFVARRKQERQRMRSLMDKAIAFHNRKLCFKVYSALHNEVVATRQRNKRNVRLGNKYARIWKHRVDLAFTATCVREEKLYLMVWKKWHLEFVKRKVERKVVAFEKKQKLSMIFISWLNLCRKKSQRLSMIPLPVSPAFNMPTALRSSDSTPTDELFSPFPSPIVAKPTQIPLPNSSSLRGKSMLHASNGRSTPTGQNGRSTPTQIGRKSSTTS